LRAYLIPSLKALLVGDWNTEHRVWHCRTKNANGRVLYNFLSQHPISISAPNKATSAAFRRGFGSIIDLAVLRNLPLSLTPSLIYSFTSDHLPLLYHIPLTLNPSPPPRKTATDWCRFPNAPNTCLLSVPFLASPPEAIEERASALTETLLDAEKYASRTLPEQKSARPRHFPSFLVDLIKARNAARHSWQRTRDPADKSRYNRLANDVKSEIRRLSADECNRHIESLSFEEGSSRKQMRALRH
jgi:hypothetical protein